MKKLKVYKNPDFRMVEACMESTFCGKPLSGSSYGQSDIVVDESTDADEGNQAPIFRPGIWDEE